MSLAKIFIRFIVALTGAALFFYSGYYIAQQKPTNKGAENQYPIWTNESYINGLYYHNIDLDNAVEVFRYFYQQLDDNVTIYTSENLYYFIFPLKGKILWGSMGLFVDSRDSGIVRFGYHEKLHEKRQKFTSGVAGGKEIGSEDGLQLVKEDDYKYRAEFDNKTVYFHLYKNKLTSESGPNLLEEEILLGPSFDESGLQFYLVFNKKYSKLYWILNEGNYIPEEFTQQGDDILIGKRTEFVFHHDTINDRKLLIAALGINVISNGWYDGPFDQMPDNNVYDGEIEVLPYLEMAYPEYKGQLDKYGMFKDNKMARVPVANYYVYFSKSDLSFIDSCKAKNEDISALCNCLTQSVYQIPNNYYDFPTY